MTVSQNCTRSLLCNNEGTTPLIGSHRSRAARETAFQALGLLTELGHYDASDLDANMATDGNKETKGLLKFSAYRSEITHSAHI